MKKLLLIASLHLSFTVFSQEKDSTNTIKTGFHMNVMIANASPALGDLNRQLRAAGQLPIDGNLLGISVGTTTRFADQNSYGVIRLSALTNADTDPNSNQTTRLMVWELTGIGHYDVVANPNWLVYPYLGLGTSYGRLTVSSVENSGNFQNSLSNLGDDEIVQKKYGTDGIMTFVELGGGVERILRLSGSDLYLGVSGGYRLSTREAWALNNVKVFDNTSFSTQGWILEFKLRVEVNPSPGEEVSRGLFKYFE